MNGIQFKRAPERILCLGAHPDDIEIGCGGTLLTLLNSYRDLEVRWVVFSGTAERAREAKTSADLFLRGAGKATVEVKDFRDGFFPYSGPPIKESFEELKSDFSPDLIFTHFRDDLHQDHRLISELTWNTFRNHMILEYEIPKYDGDLGAPNVFVHLDETVCAQKADHIKQCFVSQRDKHWFRENLFYALLSIRGVESVSPTQYAEAFYGRKMVF